MGNIFIRVKGPDKGIDNMHTGKPFDLLNFLLVI